MPEPGISTLGGFFGPGITSGGTFTPLSALGGPSFLPLDMLAGLPSILDNASDPSRAIADGLQKVDGLTSSEVFALMNSPFLVGKGDIDQAGPTDPIETVGVSLASVAIIGLGAWALTKILD